MHLGIGASTKQIILSTVMVFIGISKRGIRERQSSCDTREFVKLKSTNGKTNSKNNTLVEMARVFLLQVMITYMPRVDSMVLCQLNKQTKSMSIVVILQKVNNDLGQGYINAPGFCHIIT